MFSDLRRGRKRSMDFWSIGKSFNYFITILKRNEFYYKFGVKLILNIYSKCFWISYSRIYLSYSKEEWNGLV